MSATDEPTFEHLVLFRDSEWTSLPTGSMVRLRTSRGTFLLRISDAGDLAIDVPGRDAGRITVRASTEDEAGQIIVKVEK